MISTSIFELGSCNVKDSFSCTLRDQMYKSKKILAGITEAHSTAGSGFIVRSGTGHVKGYHTLVLVPDICHTVYVRILTLYMIAGEKIIPVSIQDGESFIYLFGSFEFLHDLLSRLFFDHV